jgi:hypothetical protein
MNVLQSNYFEHTGFTKPDRYHHQYLQGTFYFITLDLTLDLEFQIFNEDQNKETSLAIFEDLFDRFYRKFDKVYLTQLMDQIVDCLKRDITKDQQEDEIKRLKKSLKLDCLVFSFERKLNLSTDDDIPPYSERHEIIMRLLDTAFLNSHEIVVEIDPNTSFHLKDAFFEGI